MKITWIGQAGLILKSQGKTVIVDPYLSDSVKKVNPHNYRRVPVDTNLFGIKPDIIILTHNHMDHTDEETLRHYITQDSRVTVLASGEAWKRCVNLAVQKIIMFCSTAAPAGQMEASDSAPSTRSIPIAVQLA